MFRINFTQGDRLMSAMENYQGNVESAINEVLHEQAGVLANEAIRRLIPVSGEQWKGKKPAAKIGKSLLNVPGNLSLIVTTTKNYQYLYFPNDGSNTRRHAGQQFFFERGGEAVQDQIIDLCIARLIDQFESEV